MDILFLIGRILLAVIFLLSAIGHLTQSKGMAQYAASKGVPAAEAGVIVSGVVFALGGLAILLGIWTDLAALAIALVLIPVTFMMHPHWKETDPQAKQGEQINFNKNLALIGGLLILFYLVNQTQDIPAGITGPLFGAW
jgi:putative oxidoreductase